MSVVWDGPPADALTTWWIQRVLTSCGQAEQTSTRQTQQQQQQQHLAALEQHSIREALVRLLLRFSCTAAYSLTRTGAHEHESVSSILQIEKIRHVTTITRLLKRNKYDTNTSTALASSHRYTSTQQRQQLYPAALEQHSTREALVRLLLLLLFCCCVLLLEHDELDNITRNAIRGINTKIRQMMHRTETLKNNYHVSTWSLQRLVVSCGQAVTSTRALSAASSRSSNTQQHSSNTRFKHHSYSCCCGFFAAAYCSSSTRAREHE